MSKPEGTSSFRDKLGGWPEGCPSGLRHVRTLSWHKRAHHKFHQEPFKDLRRYLSLNRDGVQQGDGVMKAALPLVLTALLGLGSGGAAAQIAPGDPAGNQTIPEKDLSRPAEGGTPNGNATSDGNQSLSDKLDESGGVIKPAEGVDPQIVQPAPVPDPKSTPVIPPAGTPGGRPGPKPK
jgi:hypothetical protein